MVDYKKKQEERRDRNNSRLRSTDGKCVYLVYFGGVELGDDPLHDTETERQRAGKIRVPAYEAC